MAPRGDTLRILSFNVWHGYPGSGAREERYQRIRDLVAETDPDVVLLQEAWSTRRFGKLAERLSRDSASATPTPAPTGLSATSGSKKGS